MSRRHKQRAWTKFAKGGHGASFFYGRFPAAPAYENQAQADTSGEGLVERAANRLGFSQSNLGARTSMRNPMKTRSWCLASVSLLCLCVGTPTFADNNASDQLRGSAPSGQNGGGRPGPGGGGQPPGRPGSPGGGNVGGPGQQRPQPQNPAASRPNPYMPDQYRADQYRPGNYQPDSNRPDYNRPEPGRPGFNRPDPNDPYYSRPDSRPNPGWHGGPNGGSEPPASSLPIQPRPDEVRQTEPPLRGSYPDLPRQYGDHRWGDGDDRWPGRGNGWGPGPQYRPGQRIDRFPGDHYRVPYRGSDYFYSSGYWYRPNGPGYVVVAPPRGIRVRYLPDYASRVWIGGGMFFLAAGTYYQWANDTQEYVVVEAPSAPAQSQPQPVPQALAAPGGYDVAFYPANGQTPAQMERDRYECQRWAAQQTGFDPGTATYAPSEQVVGLFRQNMANCLASRGYGLN